MRKPVSITPGSGHFYNHYTDSFIRKAGGDYCYHIFILISMPDKSRKTEKKGWTACLFANRLEIVPYEAVFCQLKHNAHMTAR